MFAENLSKKTAIAGEEHISSSSDSVAQCLSSKQLVQKKTEERMNKSSSVQNILQLQKQVNSASSGTGVIQLLAVGESDVGKRFKVRAADGTVGYAVLVGSPGGGWFNFKADDGSDINVRGQSNILSRADARPMDAKSRLTRAQARATARGPLAPLGTRVDAPTPFGMTGLSRQRFSPSEPQTTSRSGDFGGAADPGPRYDQWVGKIGGTPAWSAMSGVVDSGGSSPPPSFNNKQNRAAAMIHGTSHYSEPYRFRGAPKAARSASRLIGQGTYSSSQYTHLFPMAGEGGAHVYDDYLAGKVTLDSDQERVLEDMSDSSDDES